MASSRRRRSRRNYGVRGARERYPVLIEPVIEQVHFGKKTYRAGRAARPPARAQSPHKRIRRELRRRALATTRSLTPSALADQVREDLQQLRRPLCKPRPDSRKAGRSRKKKRGLGGAARAFIPWCKG